MAIFYSPPVRASKYGVAIPPKAALFGCLTQSYYLWYKQTTMPFNLQDLEKQAGGRLIGQKDVDFQYVYIDNRTAWRPESGLFVALAGTHNDGHAFIDGLYKRGMRAFLVSRPPEVRQYPGAGFWVAEKPVQLLQQWAARHRRQYHYPVIGITGSNGKTILKEWIFQALREKLRMVRSPKSYNSQLGVPLSVLQMEAQHDLGIFEAGISRPGEMARLQQIIRPTIGIFTTIGDAHQEQFRSLEEKAAEKMQLFNNANVLIARASHEMVLRMAGGLKELQQVFTWAVGQEADVVFEHQSVTDYQVAAKGTSFRLRMPFTDEASLENSMHLVSLLIYLGYTGDFIQGRLNSLVPVNMRLEALEGINGCTVINDSYNSDMNSLEVALNTLDMQTQRRSRTVILADMLQNARDEEALYRDIALRLKSRNINRLIGIGSAMLRHRHLLQTPGMQTAFYPTTEAYLGYFSKAGFRDEAVLIKGARNYQLERISEQLQKKIHQTVLEINLDAISHNLRVFKYLLKPRTRLMVMVKAFSYGSGSYEIASLLQREGVDYLGVAVADEGVELRNAGIAVPVLVMNPQPGSFETMVRHGLEPEIYNLQALRQFERVLQQAGETAYPVHLKLDTGMHRLGFMEADIPELLRLLRKSQKIRVAGIFSHLAGTDEEVHDDFTHQQVAAFERMSKQVMQELDYPVIRHLLNSAGIERFPDAQYDMVRLGIGLYGIGRKYGEKLQTISSLKTHILQIRSLPPGETVGYGRSGKVKRKSRIGVLPVGYADGFNRLLSNGVGEVLVKGRRVPVIGSVCMDMTMIDLGGVDAREGDEAVVFGPDLPITEMAEKLHTIPYEILTSISRRVKRVYVQDYQ